MGEAKSMSLETKAAIIGAVYAFEHMMAKSSQAGTDLTNFSLLMGESSVELQKWQYAAMQAGDRSEDFTKSVLSMKNAVNEMLLNKSAPEYMGMVMENVSQFDPTRFQDAFYMMGKLQEAAQNMRKHMQGSLATHMLKGFGLGDSTIAAMYRNAFTPQQIGKAPHYSESEIKSLDRANIAWANLGNKIELAFGRFNARHGTQIVNSLKIITDAAVHLAESLESVSQKFKIIETAGHALEGIANTIKLITEVVDKLGGKESKKGDFLYRSPNEEIIPGFSESPLGKFFKSISSMLSGNNSAPSVVPSHTIPLPAYPAPKMPHALYPSAKGNETNVDVKQTVIFQGHHEAPKRTSDALRKEVGDYFKQSAAKTVGG